MLSEVWDQKEDFGLKWRRAEVKSTSFIIIAYKV
jgi:hypothetical protein